MKTLFSLTILFLSATTSVYPASSKTCSAPTVQTPTAPTDQSQSTAPLNTPLPESTDTPQWGEPLPPVSGADSYENAFVKMLLTLLALLILVFISFWLFKRMAHGRFKAMNFNRDIKIIERRPLSAKSMLYLIEIKGKTLLVSESQLEVRTLGDVPEMDLNQD